MPRRISFQDGDIGWVMMSREPDSWIQLDDIHDSPESARQSLYSMYIGANCGRKHAELLCKSFKAVQVQFNIIK